MTLLPPNSTKLQRDLEIANDNSFDIEQALENIKTIKSNPPEQILYWLIWEFGLGEILPYISDLRRLITDGLQWQRVRGTPASLKIALDWINFADAGIEEEPTGLYYYQYQLKLKRIPDKIELEKIRNVSALSSPVRSRLTRLYNDEYDVRDLILSKSKFGKLLSDYSDHRYNGLVLSFGRNHGFRKRIPKAKIKACQNSIICKEAHYTDRPLLSYMSISDVPLLNRLATHSRLHTIRFSQPNDEPIIAAGLDWFGAWNKRTWESPGFLNVGIRRTKTRGLNIKFTEPEISNSIRKMHYCHASIKETIPDRLAMHGRLNTIHFSRPDNEPIVTAGLDWFGAWNKRTWESPGFFNVSIKRTKTRGLNIKFAEPELSSSISKKRYCHASIKETMSARRAMHDRLNTIYLAGSEDEPISSSGLDWFGSWDKRTWALSGFINIGILQGKNYSSGVQFNEPEIKTGREKTTFCQVSNQLATRWTGDWDNRNWFSSYTNNTINIGVIHYGNTD